MNEQLFAASGRGGVRDRERDAQQRVGPEPALVRRAVELDQLGVDRRLIVQIHADDRRADDARDVLDGSENPETAIARVAESRSSSASCRPVLAPDGTIARPRASRRSQRIHFHRRPSA